MVMILPGEFESMNSRVNGNAPALQDPQSWKDRASCRGLGCKSDGIFFPSQGKSVREAKTICSGCPVVAQCLEYALKYREKHGIWGGTTERERRSILRRRRTGS